MTTPRAGVSPLWLWAAVAALAAGLIVALRGPTSLPLRVGSPAPEVRLPDLLGQELSIAELRGSVVFVNFWSTWCAPCRTEAPSLERLYQKLRGERFEILGVSVDGPGAPDGVEAFRDEFGLSFPILLDPHKKVYDAYQATGVPETFVIGSNGRLEERFVGPRDWDHPRYERAVRRLLANPEVPADG